MRPNYKLHKTYGELEDFLLVMWKNLVLKYRRLCSTAIEIFVPIISCLFALLVMSQTKRIEYKTRTYPGFSVTSESPPIATIQWSPCGNPLLRSIMKNVVKLLKVEEECFNTSKVLRSELQFSEASKTVGVQFDDALGNQTNFSKHIDITFRFEEKPFLYYYYWRTNLLFPTDEVAGPRDPDYEHGAVPYYYEDGFLTLQHTLALEVIRSKSSKSIPMIQMQRFPYPAWTAYEELNSSIDIVMFMLIFGFIFIYGNTIRCVAVEKESQVKYGKNKVVLDDISLNILEGEITVLLGHSGAGKTTTASILTGILPATRGTALVDGHNVQTDMRKIRGKLGFCPQRNVLWDNLTVKQHLYFFAKLKGLREPELSEDIHKNLELFDLYEKRKTRTRHLSRAMKRKLSVGIALSGNSRICIFDEPTADTDPASTKHLWDIIRSQKEDRTIVWTTSSMEEADCLGDRIGLLTHGQLQCFGSSSFLKRYYGSGYRLLIIKLPQASVDRITQALQSYIPSIEVEQDNGKELSYILPEDETPVFEKLLRELENNGHNLGVQSFSITLATMEEVFMKVGIDYTGAHDDQYTGSVSDYILTNNKYVEDLSVYGIGQHLIYLFLVGLLLFLVVLSMQSRLSDTILYTFIDLLRRSPSDNGIHDPDVLDETNKVRNEQINRRIYEVVLKDVTKYYKRTVAVNQLCLGLKEFECFGLVGTPGAGKSTALKLLAGQIKLSYGDAWISGFNLKQQMSKIRTCIGYCPQYDALFGELTGKETLIIYCLIRGIPITHCTATAKKLAKEFKFFKSLNQTVSYYSGGTKRKLSAAVALIGEPKVILLDEPTAGNRMHGMDPHTKRFIWNSLSRIKENGKCLIVVTDNMDECEAVCTRMGIMVDGSLQCLGAPQNLKNKYEGEYALTIKVSAIEQSQFEEVDNYIQKYFFNVERRDVGEGVVLYIFREMQHMYWSQLFKIMEDGKKEVAAIEDYWLSQFSLERFLEIFPESGTRVRQKVRFQVKVLGSVQVSNNRFLINLLINRALVLFWSPCGNPFLTMLVVNVSINLKMAEKCYKNKNELQAALQYYGNKPVIGLQFEDVLANREKSTKTLNIVIRLVSRHVNSSNI
ncbi:atp-binding cassette transporter subfamily a abca [Holotrichia oblita]|uniref:Atp-binding cassette transporter subfamily a abca n=1 Tax=Holotrichia oblita TaxID=644536 RepID=A0ACB9T8U4_HOLOL|nr:atp-binding cassette transporter subfamily a abca [Holotrichia oblita]